jgi:Na+-translocating ferredoxin:NAD+ oxidoreductase RnfG subunit
MDPLLVKFIEVLIMQVLVFGAVTAILTAAVWDVVQAKVSESRRRDQIAAKPITHKGLPHPHIHNPFAHHHV